MQVAVAGFVAAFDGPARGIRCASEIIDDARELGFAVRAGLHTGECDAVNGELSGIAVETAARIVGRAESGGIAVSRTVKDLVAGSGIAFERIEGRLHSGTPGGLDVYRVVGQPVAASGIADVVDMPPATGPLTRREREVAVLIGRGLTNRDIAETLSISVATVERHAANIFTKLDVHSRTQVAVWMIERGLLPPSDA